MAAAVVVTPNPGKVGTLGVITATGFLPSTTLSITIPEYGFIDEQTSDASGAIGGADLANKAVQTLTSDGTNVTAADTVTVGSVTYTFRASVTTTANEVKIGADAATTLANLKHAINADGTTSVYGSLTVANPDAGAGALTTTTLVVYALVGGTAGNSLTTTEASTHLSYGAATMAGGSAATGIDPVAFTPVNNTPYTVTVSDGTSTVSVTVPVFSE